MNDVKSCLLVGVGGQGAILISKIMSNGFMKAGYDVKQSEVHGMAQRGGSVSTQVRWGKKVYGPVFGKGEADIMVALEKMEAVRYAEFLNPNGVAVINDYAIKSTTIASGAEAYPEGCIEAMQKNFKTIAVPASDIAIELGNPKCMNVVLFGAMCDSLGCPEIDWEQVVAETVPAKVKELTSRPSAPAVKPPRPLSKPIPQKGPPFRRSFFLFFFQSLPLGGSAPLNAAPLKPSPWGVRGVE